MTIMSYWCGAPLANHFSNPDVSYLDKPTGTETENNVREIRNNMVRLNSTVLSSRRNTQQTKREKRERGGRGRETHGGVRTRTRSERVDTRSPSREHGSLSQHKIHLQQNEYSTRRVLSPCWVDLVATTKSTTSV